MPGTVLYPDESYKIMGACFAVYNEMGAGFAEAVYQECLQIEFSEQKIPVAPKPGIELSYRGRKLEKKFEPDFVCYGKIILELKSVSTLVDVHRGQVHNYLKATQFELGILANFSSHPRLDYERIAKSIRK